MKTGLAPAQSFTRQITIDKLRTIDFLGEQLRVYATPELVRDIEMTCREFLLGYADTGEDSVGTAISISHSGATLLGMQVVISCKVKEVKGRQISFEVSAHDGSEQVCVGEHSRFMVEVEKLRARVAAKAASSAPG